MMFIIHSEKTKNGIVWNPETLTPLAKFVGGVFETEDETVAFKLQELGYEVEGEFTPPKPELADLTIPQLKEFAAANALDIGKAEKKADILEAIAKALEEEEDGESEW